MALALALGVPALAAAAVALDGPDAQAGAQPVELLPATASELVDRPGDQDWYSVLGRTPDDSVNAVFVRVLQSPPGCGAPLPVALFNPEGRWMRTTRSSAGRVATVLLPGLPSRYLLRAGPTEAACTGLEYEVTSVATDRPAPDGSASACVVARAARIDAQDRLRMLEVARTKYAPDTRPRYDRYVARAKAAVAAARRAVRRACA